MEEELPILITIVMSVLTNGIAADSNISQGNANLYLLQTLKLTSVVILV